MNKLIAIMVLTLGANGGMAQSVPDIGGVKIRAPLMAQRALIEKLNPAYKISELKTSDGRVIGLEALARVGMYSEVSDHLVALQEERGNVWFIGRRQILAQGKFVPVKTLYDAFLQKYGSYTLAADGLNKLEWHFHPTTAQLFASSKENTCQDRFNLLDGGLDINGMTAPTSFSSRCGLSIYTSFYTWPKDPSLVVDYEVKIVDRKPRFDELQRKKSEAESAVKREADAMRNNKVSL